MFQRDVFLTKPNARALKTGSRVEFSVVLNGPNGEPHACAGLQIRNPKKVKVSGKALVPDFGGLVLGCIEADFCKLTSSNTSIYFAAFFRSTIFTHFCTVSHPAFSIFQ